MLKCLIMAFMKVKKRVKCHDIMINKRHPNSEVWMPLIFDKNGQKMDSRVLVVSSSSAFMPIMEFPF